MGWSGIASFRRTSWIQGAGDAEHSPGSRLFPSQLLDRLIPIRFAGTTAQQHNLCQENINNPNKPQLDNNHLACHLLRMFILSYFLSHAKSKKQHIPSSSKTCFVFAPVTFDATRAGFDTACVSGLAPHAAVAPRARPSVFPAFGLSKLELRRIQTRNQRALKTRSPDSYLQP